MLSDRVPTMRDERLSMQDRLARLEGAALFSGAANIIIGKSQFRDDFLRELRDGKKVTKQNSKGDWVVVLGSNDKSDGVVGASGAMPGSASNGKKTDQGFDGTALDNWAAGLSKAQWSTVLRTKGLEHLSSEYGFAQDVSYRQARNGQAHDGSWKLFAHSLLRAVELEDNDARQFMENHAKAFEFTYDMSWEEAAEQARRDRLGSGVAPL